MDNPVGTIQAIQDTQTGLRLTVEVDAGVACPRCAAGKGCGAGLFTGEGKKRVVAAEAVEPVSLAVGDSVELQMPARNLRTAALIVYGLPLLGALTGATLAFGLQLSELAGVAVVVASATVGAAIGRWHLGQTDCLQQFVPQVQKRI